MDFITDTHCHLDFEAFDEDRDLVLARARQAGVQSILNPGIDLSSSQKAVKLAKYYPEVYAAVGVHPNSAHDCHDEVLHSIYMLVTGHSMDAHPKVKAIGEIGLDYYRDRTPREIQRRVFKDQLKLAQELNLPVVIHNRQATEIILEMLGEWHEELVARGSPLAERPGVLHSFSGDMQVVQQAIGMNFLLGISGSVTYKNATQLHKLIADLPLENVLVETDAPFLPPHPHRGQRNEPAYVRGVVDKIALIKGMSGEMVAETTTHNASRIFNW